MTSTQPLTIEDVPRPEPSDGQVLVRIEACGLCHTDIHAAHGDWPIKPAVPLIPGHEGVGIVEALGPGAGDEIGVGDRVAIPWLGFACGHCRCCNSGRKTLCEAQINTRLRHGRRVRRVHRRLRGHVVKVPDGVDSLARGGTLMMVALPQDNYVRPIFETVLRGIGIKGSIVGTHRDVEDVFKAAHARPDLGAPRDPPARGDQRGVRRRRARAEQRAAGGPHRLTLAPSMSPATGTPTRTRSRWPSATRSSSAAWTAPTNTSRSGSASATPRRRGYSRAPGPRCRSSSRTSSCAWATSCGPTSRSRATTSRYARS